jgi:hypothetical protein
MELPKTIDELSSLSPNFIGQIWNQFKREISFFQIELIDSLQPTSISKIQEVVISILKSGEFKSIESKMQLVYRVDIPEETIQQYLYHKTFDSIEEALSECLLIRIAQKVYFRNQFSTKQSNEDI